MVGEHTTELLVMEGGHVCLTYGGASMALREFAHSLARLSVVEKNLPV